MLDFPILAWFVSKALELITQSLFACKHLTKVKRSLTWDDFVLPCLMFGGHTHPMCKLTIACFKQDAETIENSQQIQSFMAYKQADALKKRL